MVEKLTKANAIIISRCNHIWKCYFFIFDYSQCLNHLRVVSLVTWVAILKTCVVFNYTGVRKILQKSVCDVEYGYIKINTWV